MKIVTMGEIMLRLSAPGNQRFAQSERFEATYAGAEANVAVSLANLGHEVYYVTKVPAHEIGQCAVNALRKYGVHTDYIARGGNRLGIYYLETGASVRPSKVIYDRAGSSMAEAALSDFDFDKIFEGADWFHWSGITPAISESAAEIVKEACVAAKKKGITVSCDLNYRGKLWAPERAFSVMKPLMKYVDVCFGIDLYFEFRPEKVLQTGERGTDAYRPILKALREEYGFKTVVTTVRESYSASRNGWKALIDNGTEFYESKEYDIDPIVDRVGGGDAFAAGLIHGLLKYNDPAKALEFAVAASALKHTIPGDANLVSESEALTLADGDGSGRVQR